MAADADKSKSVPTRNIRCIAESTATQTGMARTPKSDVYEQADGVCRRSVFT
jgi:hypothetical protein